MDSARSKLIIETLNKKGVNKPCPRCGHPHFSVVAEAEITVVEDTRWRAAVPQALPIVVVACSNCGFVSQHALGPIGLLEEGAHAG